MFHPTTASEECALNGYGIKGLSMCIPFISFRFLTLGGSEGG